MADGVGRTLREARNRRQIDLAQVEASTKIRVHYLRALENEEWEVLPGEAYVRGFIRTYASCLGLDGVRLAEEHRREGGGDLAGERLPRSDPAPLAARRPRRGPRPSSRVLAAAVSLALVALLLVIGLSSGGGGPAGTQEGHRGGRGARKGSESRHSPAVAKPKRGLTLHLAATAEVWVCLLDAKGEPLVNGRILASGTEVGPFRSGSFTVSLGNGEVSMTVNGRQASIPATSSPIGYSIDAAGEMHELSEGDRPTCT